MYMYSTIMCMYTCGTYVHTCLWTYTHMNYVRKSMYIHKSTYIRTYIYVHLIMYIIMYPWNGVHMYIQYVLPLYLVHASVGDTCVYARIRVWRICTRACVCNWPHTPAFLTYQTFLTFLAYQAVSPCDQKEYTDREITSYPAHLLTPPPWLIEHRLVGWAWLPTDGKSACVEPTSQLMRLWIYTHTCTLREWGLCRANDPVDEGGCEIPTYVYVLSYITHTLRGWGLCRVKEPVDEGGCGTLYQH